jgi:hypothetical protein
MLAMPQIEMGDCAPAGMFARSQSYWSRHRSVKTVNCYMYNRHQTSMLEPDRIRTGPLFPVLLCWSDANVQNISADYSLESYVAQLERNYVSPAENTLAVTAVTETVTETIERLSDTTETSSLRQFRHVTVTEIRSASILNPIRLNP